MHRSRLAGFIIDCNTDNLEQAAEFWSAALGYELRPKQEEASPLYREMLTGELGLHVEVQAVKHESRVHLDIESDDIEAEVQRLEALGAKRVGTVHSWCVMEAPTAAILYSPAAEQAVRNHSERLEIIRRVVHLR